MAGEPPYRVQIGEKYVRGKNYELFSLNRIMKPKIQKLMSRKNTFFMFQEHLKLC